MTDDVRNRLRDLIVRLHSLQFAEDEEDGIYKEIARLSPDPEWNYVYYSDEFSADDGSLDIEGVLDRILSYRPIILDYRPA